MSSYLLFCCICLILLLCGYALIFFTDFNRRPTKDRIYIVISYVVLIILFLFVITNTIKKEKDAVNIIETVTPIQVIEKDTINLYKVDGKYYKYSPKSRQLIYYGKIDEENILNGQ